MVHRMAQGISMRNKIGHVLLLAIIFLIAPSHSAAMTISAREYVPMGEFKLTAFCPCSSCSENYSYNTASGKTAKEKRTIAVDPDVIAYGTQVLIGDNVYIAEDCGGGIKGDHIDIFFDSHESIEKFEVKYCNVYIIRGDWEQ